MKRDRSSNHRAYIGLWQVLCADIKAFSLVFLWDSSSESLIPVPVLKDYFPSEDFLVCLDVMVFDSSYYILFVMFGYYGG